MWIHVAKKLILFSETVPRYIWNQLPDNLKEEIEVQVETSHQQQIVQRMNYDF